MTQLKNKNLKVKPEANNERLDVFLSKKLKVTRSQIQKMISSGFILVNEKLPKKMGDQVKTGDTVVISSIKREISTDKRGGDSSCLIGRQTGVSLGMTVDQPTLPPRQTGPTPPKRGVIPLSEIKIVAETNDYLVVDKPNGMLAHSTMKQEKDSLAEILLQKYPEIKKVGENPMRPGIVHRLDKDASGLLVVARIEAMFEKLKEQFKNRTIEKEYLVLVHGQVEKDDGEIDFPIARSYRQSRMASRPKTIKGEKDDSAGKQALTYFQVEKRFVNFTLLKVTIKTGRMHQIRAHMLAYNHPVVGDPLYFQKKQKRNWDKKLGRLFLHCHKLSFKDLEGKKQNFESPLPNELETFLKQLQ